MATNIDPAIVEALTEWWASLCDDPDDAAFVRAAHATAEEAAEYAAALTPTLAAAVDAAEKRGAARVREAVEAYFADMGDVWGGTRSWLTTGDHVAELVQDCLREAFDEAAPHD